MRRAGWYPAAMGSRRLGCSALCLSLVIGGCGGAAMPRGETAVDAAGEPMGASPALESDGDSGRESERESEPGGSVEQYARRIDSYAQELDAALAIGADGDAEEDEAPAEALSTSGGEAPATPDHRCDTAGELADRICELAARICAIAEDHPDDAGLQEKCASAKASCERARYDFGRAC